MVAFHEVLHFFGFIDYDENNPNNGFDWFADGMIMTTDWFVTSTLDGYTTLHPPQIKKIQANAFPH